MAEARVFDERWGSVYRLWRRRDLNLGFTKEDDAEAVRENRRRFREAVSREGDATELVCVRQVHGACRRES